MPLPDGRPTISEIAEQARAKMREALSASDFDTLRRHYEHNEIPTLLINEVERLRAELAECQSVIGGLRVREEQLRRELAEHPACTIGCSTCDGAMDAMDAFDAENETTEA